MPRTLLEGEGYGSREKEGILQLTSLFPSERKGVRDKEKKEG